MESRQAASALDLDLLLPDGAGDTFRLTGSHYQFHFGTRSVEASGPGTTSCTWT